MAAQPVQLQSYMLLLVVCFKREGAKHLIMDLLAVFVNMAYCLMFLLACSQAAFFFFKYTEREL